MGVDGDRFSALVREHDRRFRALAFRLLGDGDRMDDVLQDAYLKAFRRRHTFSDQADPATWLYRIVLNTCLDDLRRGRRRPPAAALESGHVAMAAGSDQTGDRDRLSRAFAVLPPDQKATVWLVDVEGFDYAAAGDLLGVAPGTVGSRLTRAHTALRAVLEEEREEA